MVSDRKLILSCALAFLGCGSPTPTPTSSSTSSSPTAVRAAVDSQFTKLFDAYRQRDGAKFAALYAPDAKMQAPEGTLDGRAAIQSDMQRGLASVRSVTDDTATTDEFVASGDEAIQVGHIVWTETDAGKPPVRDRLTFALTWRRGADSVWRIARDINYQTVVK